MVNYILSIKRPFRDWKNLIIGSLILLVFVIAGFTSMVLFLGISFFINNAAIQYLSNIILIFILAIPTAYFVKCGLTATKKNFSLPALSGWAELLKKGFILGVIILIYSIPLSIISGSISSAIIGKELQSGLKELSEYPLLQRNTPDFTLKQQNIISQLMPKLPLLLPIIILISLIWWSIITVATFKYMEKGNFKDGFDLHSILKTAFSPSYLLAFLLLILIQIASLIILVIVSLLLILTVIGIIFLIPLLPLYCYAMGIISYTILGQAYGEAK